RARAVLEEGDDFLERRPAGDLRAALAQLRLDERREARVGGLLEVLLVDPGELLGIELRRGARHAAEVEPLHQLVARKDLGVAVRPAQAREIVDERLRE